MCLTSIGTDGHHLRLSQTRFPRLNDVGIRFLSASRKGGSCYHRYWNIRLQRHWLELSPHKYFRSELLNPTNNHVFAFRSSTIAAINNSNGEAIVERSKLVEQSRDLKVICTSRNHDEHQIERKEKGFDKFEILNKESKNR